jgi:hypothetical protein
MSNFNFEINSIKGMKLQLDNSTTRQLDNATTLQVVSTPFIGRFLVLLSCMIFNAGINNLNLS